MSVKNILVKNYAEEWDEYQISKKWKELREEAYMRDGGMCKCCGNTENLLLHHVRYCDHPGKDDCLENVVTVCKKCHDVFHGTFQHNYDFLQKEKDAFPNNLQGNFIIIKVEQNSHGIILFIQDEKRCYRQAKWFLSTSENGKKFTKSVFEKIGRILNLTEEDYADFRNGGFCALVGRTIPLQRGRKKEYENSWVLV